MCYSVYISTNSSEDLSTLSSHSVRFERLADTRGNSAISLLEYPHKWYVGSVSGCSCSFRHLTSVELGFEAPVEWYPEEEQDIAATKELHAILSNLLSAENRVDLVDTWQGASQKDIVAMEVSLGDVSAEAFRLFENHRFRLKK